VYSIKFIIYCYITFIGEHMTMYRQRTWSRHFKFRPTDSYGRCWDQQKSSCTQGLPAL